MKNFVFLFMFSFFCLNSFAQKNAENNANYIGEWTRDDYKETFFYNPTPIPFSFSDEMVSSHFTEVWGFDIFTKFPSYPRFNAEKKENTNNEDVVLYLERVSKWLNENPSFKAYLKENTGY